MREEVGFVMSSRGSGMVAGWLGGWVAGGYCSPMLATERNVLLYSTQGVHASGFPTNLFTIIKSSHPLEVLNLFLAPYVGNLNSPFSTSIIPE